MIDSFSPMFSLFATLIVGCLFAGLYFGGLWCTVRCLPDTRHPWMLYFGSLLVRLALVLGGFYVVIASCGWPLLLACVLGFLSTRILLVRFLGSLATHADAVESTSG